MGKSCLLLQFIDNRYSPVHDLTIGIDFGSKICPFKKRDGSLTEIKLQIWDTAGQESFRSIARSYYRDADGAFICFDVTRRETFRHVQRWLEEARLYGKPDLLCAIVGNKSDMPQKREVSLEEAQAVAKEHGLIFFEVSAKSAKGVPEAFCETAQAILDNKPDRFYTESVSKSGADSLSLNGGKQGEDKKCC